MQELVGFFIIEAHVLRATPDFRSQRDVDDLWDEMCRRIVEVMAIGLKGCSEPEVFLESKTNVLLFVQTLEVGGRLTMLMPGIRVQCHRAEWPARHAIRAVLGASASQVQLGLRPGPLASVVYIFS